MRKNNKGAKAQTRNICNAGRQVAIKSVLLLVLTSSFTFALAEEEGHNESEVEIKTTTRDLVPIVTQKLQLQTLPITVSAPGEVRFNEYKSADISPLIDSTVVERLAKMGDRVEASQALVTLISVEVAQAKGEFDVASREWRRVRSLGENTVGSKRFAEARVAYEQAIVRLATYGLTANAIEQIESGKNSLPLGQFQLTAPIAGTVLNDSFKLGQRIPAGQTMFVISDESSIWVEASLTPEIASEVESGMPARARLAGQWHDGVVIQRHHLLDEETRTIPVRIEIQLAEDEHHHRGEFGQTEIVTSYTKPLLALPESALSQNEDGQWVVFIEDEANHFLQTPITRGLNYAGMVAIDGLNPGTTVVTDGAFYLAAELAKSGFGDDDH